MSSSSDGRSEHCWQHEVLDPQDATSLELELLGILERTRWQAEFDAKTLERGVRYAFSERVLDWDDT